MINKLKSLIKERDKLIIVAESNYYACCDTKFIDNFEAICLEILELSNKLYTKKERAVIEWDGLEKGTYNGDHRDLVMDCIINEVSRN